MKTNFELSGLNNIKENECYAIDELIAAHTTINYVAEENDYI